MSSILSRPGAKVGAFSISAATTYAGLHYYNTNQKKNLVQSPEDNTGLAVPSDEVKEAKQSECEKLQIKLEEGRKRCKENRIVFEDGIKQRRKYLDPSTKKTDGCQGAGNCYSE